MTLDDSIQTFLIFLEVEKTALPKKFWLNDKGKNFNIRDQRDEAREEEKVSGVSAVSLSSPCPCPWIIQWWPTASLTAEHIQEDPLRETSRYRKTTEFGIKFSWLKSQLSYFPEMYSDPWCLHKKMGERINYLVGLLRVFTIIQKKVCQIIDER